MSWHSTYGRQPYCNQPSRTESPTQLQIFDGYLNSNPAAWEAGLDYIVDTYFSQPNYLKVETLPKVINNGTGRVQKCCWFSFYQMEYFVAAVGGEVPAASMLQRFRQRTAAQAEKLNRGKALDDPASVCGCVNIGGMGGHAGSAGVANLDSFSDYGWMKTVSPHTFPETPYEDIVDGGIAAWGTRVAQAAQAGVDQYVWWLFVWLVVGACGMFLCMGHAFVGGIAGRRRKSLC